MKTLSGWSRPGRLARAACPSWRRGRASNRRSLELLAEADALRSLGMDRRAGLWAVKALAPEVKAEIEAPAAGADGAASRRRRSTLPAMRLPAHVAEDYRTTSLSLKAHPCAFFRPMLMRLGAVTAGARAGRWRTARASASAAWC